MTPAGQRNKQVILQAPQDIQNTYGESVPTWVSIATIFVKINHLRGRELSAAQQKYAQVETEITTEYLTNIKPTCRLKYGNKYFEILGILDPLEQHAELVLYCKVTENREEI